MAGVKEVVVLVVVLLVVVEAASRSRVVVEVRVEDSEKWDTHSTLSREYAPESKLGSSMSFT